MIGASLAAFAMPRWFSIRLRFYLGLQQQGALGWPLDTITSDTSEAGVLQALESGPYGRCVYACDNDVVDHQVVAIEFAGGVSATFTMTGFRPRAPARNGTTGKSRTVDRRWPKIQLRPFGDLPDGLLESGRSTATWFGTFRTSPAMATAAVTTA